jgi:hypothetical protein
VRQTGPCHPPPGPDNSILDPSGDKGRVSFWHLATVQQRGKVELDV